MTAVFVLALALLAQTPPSQAAQPPAQPPADPHGSIAVVYVPERVYDTRRKAFTDFEAMLADLARADVIFVGEQHDDPNTHRLEAAVLQGLMRRGVAVTVSLEMFERDVQPALDNYVTGALTEEEFVKTSRPWPRYAADYRPLVEMAKAHKWRVIASNVPRRLAATVAKGGKSALDSLAEADRAYVARDLQCPLDVYFERFSETMGSHPASGADKDKDKAKAKAEEDARATTERYYWSQCLKDETMAESIAAAFEKQSSGPGAIVHYTGAFHSDFGLGTAERVRRRLPGRRVAVVTVLPVTDLDAVTPDEEDLKRGEYLVYTIGK